MDAPSTESRESTPAMRVLVVAIVAWVTIGCVRTNPPPSLSAEGLWISASLLGVCAGMLGVLFLRSVSIATLFVLLLITVAGSCALMGLQPDGPAFLAIFPAVSAGALRLPSRLSLTVLAVALTGVALAGPLLGDGHLEGAIQVGVGVIAFYLLAVLVRRLSESDDRAKRLLVALEASSESQVREAALAERQRIAREMHDVLAHSLSGLVLNLERARILAEQEQAPDDLKESLEQSRRLAKVGLEEARGAISMLRDEELPGPDRLPSLVSDFEAAMSTPCTFEVSGEPVQLEGDARLTLFRVAQEALTNIRKHAKPTRVEMHLTYAEDGIRLTVEDFEDERSVPVQGAGYGLAGMRERAELIGGRLRAGPTETGFLVDLWEPP